MRRIVAPLLVLMLLPAACESGGGNSEPTTSSSADGGSNTAGENACPSGSGSFDPHPSAVSADLNGDGEADAAWVVIEVEVGGPRLVTLLSSGAISEIELEEDPVVEPEITSVVDIGSDRDSLLVTTGAGAYTTITAVYGFADCEIQPVVDPERPELGPFTVAEGVSVMNGSYYACLTRDGDTVLLTGSWTTTEDGEKDWSEGLFRREGLEIAQAGEAVAGVAETEEGVGTDRGEECPEPTAA